MPIIDIKRDVKVRTWGQFSPEQGRFVRMAERSATIAVSDPANDNSIRVKQELFPGGGWFGEWPVEGGVDPDDQHLICRSCDIQNAEGKALTLLRATNTFETLAFEDPTGNAGNASVPGYTATIKALKTREPFDRDYNGDPVQTVVGEQFDPPLEDDLADVLIELTATNKPYRADLLYLYMNSVNSEPFAGVFPPGVVRITDYSASTAWRADAITGQQVEKLDLMVQLTARQPSPYSTPYRAWWKRVRAEGYYVAGSILGPSHGKVRALDANGEPVTTPVCHSVTTGTEIDPENAQFYEFQPPKLVYRNLTQFFQMLT